MQNKHGPYDENFRFNKVMAHEKENTKEIIWESFALVYLKV